MALSEIVASRVLAFSREEVWDAFEDPAKLARWWGPKGFTNTFHLFEFRPGGWWKFTMHAPGGKADYNNESEFVEVARPERLVYVHHRDMHWYRMTITLAEEAGGTRIAWRMEIEADEKLQKFLAAANEENFDRLEAVLRAGPGK